jgi:hypothetical protein
LIGLNDRAQSGIGARASMIRGLVSFCYQSLRLLTADQNAMPHLHAWVPHGLLADPMTCRRCGHLMMLMLVVVMAGTGAEARMRPIPGVSCEEAMESAARANGVPTRLMAAVGLAETGRQDPNTGAWHPWPWTINAEGHGFFFGSKGEAILAVQALQANGVRSIDIGCMQVNLLHHPDAFTTLDEAFDPQHNTRYAGRFLSQLFHRSGDWIVAASWYHSTTIDLAADYAKRILAYLPGAKLGASETAGPSRSMTVRDMTPRVGRDGLIVPSARLTPLGVIASHPVSQNVRARAGRSSLF